MLLWGKIKQLGGIVTFQAYPSSKKYQEEVLQQRWKWLLIYQGHFVIRFFYTQFTLKFLIISQ